MFNGHVARDVQGSGSLPSLSVKKNGVGDLILCRHLTPPRPKAALHRVQLLRADSSLIFPAVIIGIAVQTGLLLFPAGV